MPRNYTGTGESEWGGMRRRAGGRGEIPGDNKPRSLTLDRNVNGRCSGNWRFRSPTTPPPIVMAAFILHTWLTHETRNEKCQKLKKIFVVCLRPRSRRSVSWTRIQSLQSYQISRWNVLYSIHLREPPHHKSPSGIEEPRLSLGWIRFNTSAHES